MYGESGDLRRRIQEFYKAWYHEKLLGPHAEGNRLARLTRRARDRLPSQLRFKVRLTRTKVAAKRFQDECLEEYHVRYGELPVLNHSGGLRV